MDSLELQEKDRGMRKKSNCPRWNSKKFLTISATLVLISNFHVVFWNWWLRIGANVSAIPRLDLCIYIAIDDVTSTTTTMRARPLCNCRDRRLLRLINVRSLAALSSSPLFPPLLTSSFCRSACSSSTACRQEVKSKRWSSQLANWESNFSKVYENYQW